MRKNSFAYADGHTIVLSIPKGFKKVELQTDSAGNKAKLFSYGDGSTIYFYYGDTVQQYQPIDKSMNIAKYYPENVRFYKGQDSNGLFWRESQYKNFRAGYQNISRGREAMFDFSVNYVGWEVIRKQ